MRPGPRNVAPAGLVDAREEDDSSQRPGARRHGNGADCVLGGIERILTLRSREGLGRTEEGEQRWRHHETVKGSPSPKEDGR
jgi:hypothetical protein